MKTQSQLSQSIGRFQEVFWDKRPGDRPPVGVVNPDVFLPIKYLRREPSGPVLVPADVTPDLAATDYEFGFARPAVSCDDYLPFSAAWRAVPWLEAACDCPVRYAAGSLAPGHAVSSLSQLAETPIPARSDWLACLDRQTAGLVAAAPADCWTSPTILRGPSDVLAAMRGLSEFYCDLYDDIGLIDRTAGRVNRLLIEVLDRHFAAVPAKLGGYGHIFGYWAPQRTVVIQEDVLGACSPAVYRDHFLQYNADVVEHLGPCVHFHLHSTGYRHWRDVLAIPGLAGLQLTVEANGPDLRALLPMMREVLERSRLILFVDHGFADLPHVLPHLPREGLFLMVRADHVRSEEEFCRFVAANWKRP